MYSEENLLQLSGLQHIIYCPRQCALIHVEQQWDDNYFTARGILMHDKVHCEKMERKKGVIIERSIYLKSYELGLVGKSDVVEFHKTKEGTFMPFPIEYKSGKAKKDDSDRVQLCAQAMCLEEMMNVKISQGAFFYGKTKNRLIVDFDDSLRSKTISTSRHYHELIESGETPKAEYNRKCDNCSIKEICLPKTFNKTSVKQYLTEIIKDEEIA
jgi:CRISPR-associated exonuclease Cas4